MKLLCLLLVFVAVSLAAKSYSGYQVLRVTPRTQGQLLRLHALYNEIKEEVDFWKEPRIVDAPVDVMVSPDLLSDIKLEFNRLGLEVAVYVYDVQMGIEEERCTDCVTTNADFDYTVYHTREEISQWVSDIANEYPLASEVVIGNSYEGNPIKAVKISSGGDKRIAYIQGGIHAREWISPATMMYMTSMMLSQYDTDATVKAMVDNYDWYIVPSLNVDGYDYTWTNDRLWRKNRQPTDGSRCTGTDLNRNYPYEWGGTGASANPCSETYRGTEPLSGTEVKVVHQWLQQFSGNIALFIDFHNYGQLWLYSWGYTGSRFVPQPDKDDQKSLATQATTALQSKFGTTYFVGMSGPDMYPASGASEDYGYATLGVKYSFVVELRDEGQYGFLIPDRMIAESGTETFEALKVMGNHPLEPKSS